MPAESSRRRRFRSVFGWRTGLCAVVAVLAVPCLCFGVWKVVEFDRSFTRSMNQAYASMQVGYRCVGFIDKHKRMPASWDDLMAPDADLAIYASEVEGKASDGWTPRA